MAQILSIPALRSGELEPFPKHTDARALAANTAESWTVPDGVGVVEFSGDGGFYVNPLTTATVPGDVSDGSASKYFPSSCQYIVDAGDVFSFIATATRIVTISCWKL